MTMPPALRKFSLLVHIASSVGWLGAAAVFLALAITGLIGQDAQTVRASYLAMELSFFWVIVPLGMASLASGLVQSLGTQWGLFRHYWVLVKFLLTVLATAVMLLQAEPVGRIASAAAETILSDNDLREARLSLIVHSAGGIVVLLAALLLSVYKPRGITRYGWRKQQEQTRRK